MLCEDEAAAWAKEAGYAAAIPTAEYQSLRGLR